MKRPSSLSRPIIEALYSEALILADEVRAVFALYGNTSQHDTSDRVRLALSSEGLKATTRMMHLLAWLLNHRAYLAGEMTAEQLHLHGRLPEDRYPAPGDMDLLETATRDLIDETVQLHRRIARLDRAWRDNFRVRPSVHMLHERIGRSMSRSWLK